MPERVDDPTIEDKARLWRRILPQWVHRKPDGSVRPASFAFLDRLSGELSVHIASLTTQERALQGHPDDSLAEIEAGFIRSLGYAVVRDPTPGDESHALICPASGRCDAGS
jgi:hypothetical protein